MVWRVSTALDELLDAVSLVDELSDKLLALLAVERVKVLEHGSSKELEPVDLGIKQALQRRTALL